MQRGAQFSPCMTYRYSLYRIWDRKRPRIMFIGLNPSTADERHDDPTVRRCIGFARSWGYGSLVLVNLFAYRATNPKELKTVYDPVGPRNDVWISIEKVMAERIVAAWGNYGTLFGRDKAVLATLDKVYCLGVTKAGCPRHPLYVASDTPLQEMNT